MKRFLYRLLRALVAAFAAAVVYLIALGVRSDSERRRRERARPRLLFGPVPIISIKYMCEAVRRRGYPADTFVHHVYSINAASDYDIHLKDVVERAGWPARILGGVLVPYIAFLWVLRRYDVFHYFFDGGFLRGTPLQYREVQLLHLAGKRVVMMAYGSDAAIPTLTRSLPWRQGMMAGYRDLGRREEETIRRVRYFCRRADFVVGSIVHAETLPRWDLLTTHYYPIDIERWRSMTPPSPRDGRNGPVSVVHTPNHRGFKGTELLIRACEELREEGLQVELRLLERVPNEEVRRILEESDILAEQFILGYGLSAMEGMSLGKPVMSNLSDDHYYLVHRLYTGLDECPIVSTPPESIKEELRRLVTDPELRARVGAAGRAYVERFHSYDAVGRMWEAVYRNVWYGEELEFAAWHPDRVPAGEREDGEPVPA